MDDRRFDGLAKSFASGTNRRTLIKGFLGLGGAVVAGGMRLGDDASAARRPTPTPKPVTCPGIQVWSGNQCVCPYGTKCGPDCCEMGGTCCDNACCYGYCYGEELCCPYDGIVCDGFCVEGTCCSNEDCGEGLACNIRIHTCVCQPDCDGKTCGPDGCGGTCGECSGGQSCFGNYCFFECNENVSACDSYCGLGNGYCQIAGGQGLCIANPLEACVGGECPDGYCLNGVYCVHPC